MSLWETTLIWALGRLASVPMIVAVDEEERLFVVSVVGVRARADEHAQGLVGVVVGGVARRVAVRAHERERRGKPFGCRHLLRFGERRAPSRCACVVAGVPPEPPLVVVGVVVPGVGVVAVLVAGGVVVPVGVVAVLEVAGELATDTVLVAPPHPPRRAVAAHGEGQHRGSDRVRTQHPPAWY